MASARQAVRARTQPGSRGIPQEVQGPPGHRKVREEMSENIVQRSALEDKFILLHTSITKQNNKRPINILIDGFSAHTIINSK